MASRVRYVTITDNYIEGVYQNYNDTYGWRDCAALSVTFTSVREKTDVIITANISAILYRNYYDGYSTQFYMYYGTAGSETIDYNPGRNWNAGSSNSTRNFSTSIRVTVTDPSVNSIAINCYSRRPSGNYWWAVPPSNTGVATVNVTIPQFRNVTAPTWISVNPNPCNVNSAPTISWGGASAGSMGTISYSTAVQVRKQDGTWSDWKYRLTSKTSLTEDLLNTQIISGVNPYVGIKYKYAVRSYDDYSSSEWIYSSELNVSFTEPTPPDYIVITPTTIKKDGNITVSWSGASGGSGTIKRYYLQYKTYNHTTGKWSSYTDLWNGTSGKYSANLQNIFPSASNNDRIMFRVSTLNSYNQQSSYYPTGNSPYALIKGNAIWINVNGTWKEGECWINVNGSWKEGTPYINVNGVWKETS